MDWWQETTAGAIGGAIAGALVVVFTAALRRQAMWVRQLSMPWVLTRHAGARWSLEYRRKTVLIDPAVHLWHVDGSSETLPKYGLLDQRRWDIPDLRPESTVAVTWTDSKGRPRSAGVVVRDGTDSYRFASSRPAHRRLRFS